MSKLKAIITGLERHERLNSEDIPLVIKILKLHDKLMERIPYIVEILNEAGATESATDLSEIEDQIAADERKADRENAFDKNDPKLKGN